MRRFKKAKGINSIERDYKRVLVDDYVKDFVEVDRFIECCKACPMVLSPIQFQRNGEILEQI